MLIINFQSTVSCSIVVHKPTLAAVYYLYHYYVALHSALPRLVRLYQSSKLEVGSPLDIECEIDCSPVAGCSVTWYFEGVAVDPEGGKYDISSVDGLVHRLSLEDPGKEDLGRYACVLRSRFSTTEDSMTITVTIPGKQIH